MPETETQALIEDAWNLVDTNRLQEARDLLAAAAERGVANSEVMMLLGTVQIELGASEAGLRLLDRAISLDSTFPDPYLHRGNYRLSQGHLAEALEDFRSAVIHDATFSEAWTALAATAFESGHPDEAAEAASRAISLAPGQPTGYIYLAKVHQSCGDLNAAAETCQTGLQQAPGAIELWMLRGSVLELQGNDAGAESCYLGMITRMPQHADGHRLLGRLLFAQHRATEAIEALEHALKLEPDSCSTLTLLGNALQSSGKYGASEACYRRALSLEPGRPVAHANLGNILQAQGKLREALEHYRAAVAIAPDRADLHNSLAMGLDGAGRFGEALQECETALQLDPACIGAAIGKAVILERQGRLNESFDTITPLVDSGVDKAAAILCYANVAHDFNRTQDAIGRLESLLKEQRLPNIEKQQVHARLGKLYDASDRYDLAMQHYKASNTLKVIDFDMSAHEQFVTGLIRQFDRRFLDSAPRADNKENLPVFIVGMPRSGTSLVEQILASHPQISGGGELDLIRRQTESLPTLLGSHQAYPDCMAEVNTEVMSQLAGQYLQDLRSIDGRASRITDKMPHNFLHLGLIQLLLPNARVIHMVRDPLDTCLSCYFQEFSSTHSYAYAQRLLGAYYNAYVRLMAHWKSVLGIPFMEVQYEQLVTNQEEISRSIIDFCGVEWDDKCLRFHESGRMISTPSYAQVRRPLYTRSVGRWKNYARHLSELKDALANTTNSS